MGFMWVLGTILVIYEMHENLLHFKHHELLKQYTIMAFTMIMGLVFVYKGKIKTTVFDKRTKTLTIKKRNICCRKRQIITYRLNEIDDVRAVYRGYKSGSVDT